MILILHQSANGLLIDSAGRAEGDVAQKLFPNQCVNGMVPVLSKELGLPTPVNDDLVAKVRLKEASFKG